jgi:tRNA(Ile2) C34 agmatinyltransferase TiaS
MHEVKLQCHGCGEINKFLLDGANKSFKCPQCKFVILEVKNIDGFIYLLSNENMPGLVKIGYCRRPVEERVKELSSQTGVPKPFSIEAYFASEKPEDDERKIHQEFSEYRVLGKEFFEIASVKAVVKVMSILDSRPIYLSEFLLTEKMQNSKVCPKCGESIIPDTYNIWLKCHSCGWTKKIREPNSL